MVLPQKKATFPCRRQESGFDVPLRPTKVKLMDRKVELTDGVIVTCWKTGLRRLHRCNPEHGGDSAVWCFDVVASSAVEIVHLELS